MTSIREPLCPSCGRDASVVTFEPMPLAGKDFVRCQCQHVFHAPVHPGVNSPRSP